MTDRRSCALVLGAWLVSAAVCGCVSSLPPDQAAIVPDARILDELATRDEISARFDAPPIGCISLLPEGEACEWRINREHPLHGPLSGQLGVNDRIGVICALPVDGGARAPGSCSLHQRRSNRTRVWVPRAKAGQSRAGVVRKIHDREHGRVKAAGTLLEMSLMLGQLPDQCVASGGDSVCEWLLRNQSYGHGTIALVVEAESDQRLRWTCRFPADGAPRAPDACSGEGL